MEPTLRSSCRKGHTPPAARSSHASVRHQTRSSRPPSNQTSDPSRSAVLLGHPHPKSQQASRQNQGRTHPHHRPATSLSSSVQHLVQLQQATGQRVHQRHDRTFDGDDAIPSQQEPKWSMIDP
ncbi:hypothetical protein ACLOJK_007134, partial [Asimina triloba]